MEMTWGNLQYWCRVLSWMQKDNENAEKKKTQEAHKLSRAGIFFHIEIKSKAVRVMLHL